MLELPNWYGTCLVLMMLATLLSLIVEPSSYKSAALVYGSILNLNAIVLLFATCLPYDDDDNDTNAKQVQDDANPTNAERGTDGEEGASNATTQETYSEQQQHQQQDYPSSNFVAMNENVVLDNPNKHNDKWFPCCCGSTFSYSCFFFLTVLLSIIVSFGTFPRWYNKTVAYYPGWESTIFLVSNGALLLSSFMVWTQRGHMRSYYAISSSSKNDENNTNTNRDGDPTISREESLLQTPSDREASRRPIMIMLISIILAATCFMLAGLGYRSVKTNRSDMLSFSEAKRSVYAGDAYVTGFTLLEYDDADDDGDAWCSNRWEDNISVNVTVTWGGSWGCPNSGAYCEAEVTTEVSCLFDTRQLYENGTDDDDWDGWDDIPQTAYDYINSRYHEYHRGDDDDGYDPYAFDFDPKTKPQYPNYIWDKPTEIIHGDCEVCEARSTVWMMEHANTVSKRLYFGNMLIGMGLVFLGWPLMIFWALRRDQDDIGPTDEMEVELQPST